MGEKQSNVSIYSCNGHAMGILVFNANIPFFVSTPWSCLTFAWLEIKRCETPKRHALLSFATVVWLTITCTHEIVHHWKTFCSTLLSWTNGRTTHTPTTITLLQYENFRSSFATDYKVFCLHNYHLFYVHALILLPINLSSLSMNCVATVRTDMHQRHKCTCIKCGSSSMYQRKTIVTNRLKGGLVQSDKVSLSFHLSVTHRSLTTKKYSRDSNILPSAISRVVHLIYGIKFFGNNSSWFGNTLLYNLIKT